MESQTDAVPLQPIKSCKPSGPLRNPPSSSQHQRDLDSMDPFPRDSRQVEVQFLQWASLKSSQRLSAPDLTLPPVRRRRRASSKSRALSLKPRLRNPTDSCLPSLSFPPIFPLRINHPTTTHQENRITHHSHTPRYTRRHVFRRRLSRRSRAAIPAAAWYVLAITSPHYFCQPTPPGPTINIQCIFHHQDHPLPPPYR